MRVEMPFVESNGKCQFQETRISRVLILHLRTSPTGHRMPVCSTFVQSAGRKYSSRSLVDRS